MFISVIMALLQPRADPDSRRPGRTISAAHCSAQTETNLLGIYSAMACTLDIAMSKCTHFLDGIEERRSSLGADDAKVMSVLSGLQDTVAHYESRRRALLNELRAPPPTSIPIPDAVRTMDCVKVYSFLVFIPFHVLTFNFSRAGFETVS